MTSITVVRMHPAVVCKMITMPGVADTDTFVMNAWNTLPERYSCSVSNNTLASFKGQIQLAENPMPAVVTSME
jgi:hypothetical protein